MTQGRNYRSRTWSTAAKDRHADVPDKFVPGWLDNLDKRTAIATVMRERFEAICNDMGGVEYLSYMQRSLIERGLWLEYWLAEQERSLAGGKDFDVGKWVQAANSLQGIYSRLGIERRQKPVPSLQEYLEHKRQEKRDNGEART